MRSFQVILLLIFGAFTILAVLIFAGIIPLGEDQAEIAASQPVVMWGTLPDETFKEIIIGGEIINELYNITYISKDPRSYEAELINALAAGRGPDMAIFSHELAEAQADKLAPYVYGYVPERTYLDTFVEGTEIFMRSGDSLAMPLFIDPVVMYWNRDLFTREGLVREPTSWLEVQLLPEKLTKRDEAGNVSQATIALGTINNIRHVKEIISAQFMQTGSTIVERTATIGTDNAIIDGLQITLAAEGAAGSALRYFAEFADPSLPKYSWNSAKADSMDEFISGKLAIYLGKASDLSIIKERNPHLNFDVALLPQIKDGNVRATYGDVYGLVVMRNSSNQNAAFAIATKWAFGGMAEVVAEVLAVPPVRRDLLVAGTDDIYQSVFYESAVISRAWPDPNHVATTGIFREMVENVLIGKAAPDASVGNAAILMEELLR